MARTARLLLGPLAAGTRWRFALGVAGGVAGPIGLVAAVPSTTGSSVGAAVIAVVALACTVAASLIERYQFFVASVAPRMPGGFRR